MKACNLLRLWNVESLIFYKQLIILWRHEVFMSLLTNIYQCNAQRKYIFHWYLNQRHSSLHFLLSGFGGSSLLSRDWQVFFYLYFSAASVDLSRLRPYTYKGVLAMKKATAGTKPCKKCIYILPLNVTAELCKSVQQACRSKNLLRLNMHRQRSIRKEDLSQKLAIAVGVLQNMQNLGPVQTPYFT